MIIHLRIGREGNGLWVSPSVWGHSVYQSKTIHEDLLQCTAGTPVGDLETIRSQGRQQKSKFSMKNNL